MISWGTIVYGAVLSAIAAALLVSAVRRDRELDILAAAALSGGLGPLLWNAILDRVEGREFFVDAPVAVNAGAESGRRVALYSLLCGLGAFLVDVYLY